MPTENNEIIQAEIVKLKELKPRIRPTTGFGDSNTDAIQAQIDVLEKDWDSDDVWDEFGDGPDNVRDAAMQAVEWKDSPDAGALVADWQELVIE